MGKCGLAVLSNTREVTMKTVGVVAGTVLILAAIFWTASTALDVERKVHYIRARKTEGAAFIAIPSSTPNWLTQDDSGRAEKEGFSERPAPPDHPPAILFIDGDSWSVHYARRSELLRASCTAQIVIRDREIWLPEDESGREIRQSVLHELLHISLYKANGEYQHPVMSDAGDGEPVVNPSARMLLTILRDNRRLNAWLLR